MENENKSLLIILILMLGIGLLICQLFFSLYKTNQQFVNKASITEAIIINKTKTDSKIIPIYEYEIAYQVKSRKFNGKITSIFNYKNSKKMTIYYETANPNWIMEKKANWRHLTLFIISILFPLYISFYIFIYFAKKMVAKKMTKNNYVIADIIKVEQNLKNKQFPYYLKCQYENIIYDSPLITEKQYNYIKTNDIRQVKLYFDNKEKYYIDVNSIYEKKEG